MKSFERTRLLALCLVAGGSALVGIFHVEGQALQQRLPDPVAARPVAARVAPPAQVAQAAQIAQAVQPAPTLAAEAPVAEPEKVEVPNLVGLRLTYAANRTERRGITIVAKDEEGNDVDLAFSSYYRVVRQSVRRGSSVEKGTVIEVRVRDRTASYSDWG